MEDVDLADAEGNCFLDVLITSARTTVNNQGTNDFVDLVNRSKSICGFAFVFAVNGADGNGRQSVPVSSTNFFASSGWVSGRRLCLPK